MAEKTQPIPPIALSAYRLIGQVGLDTGDLFDLLSDEGVRVFWELPQGEQDRVVRWWKRQRRRQPIRDLLHQLRYHESR